MIVGAGLVIVLAMAVVVALAMWIGYRLVISAVRTGILEADAERARSTART